jgi:4-azaleucine resistance transporter AzlC
VPGVREALRAPGARPVASACLGLALATGVYAISFGVGAVAAGSSIAQTCTLSLLTFTGASQFSVVSVIGTGGSPASALAGGLLLAARNGVYGLALSAHLPGSWRRRLVSAQFVIDETTAMALAQRDPALRRLAFWMTGLSLFVLWNIGTLIGALIGSAIDSQAYGLDAAFPAAFVAMLWPTLRDPRQRRARLAAALGAAICLVLIPFTPVGVPILCASLAVLVGVPAHPETAGEDGLRR